MLANLGGSSNQGASNSTSRSAVARGSIAPVVPTKFVPKTTGSGTSASVGISSSYPVNVNKRELRGKQDQFKKPLPPTGSPQAFARSKLGDQQIPQIGIPIKKTSPVLRKPLNVPLRGDKGFENKSKPVPILATSTRTLRKAISASGVNTIGEQSYKEYEERLELCKQQMYEQLKENTRLNEELAEKAEAINRLETILEIERKTLSSAKLEWKDFQDDLLLSVRAANDYRNDAREKVEAIEIENVSLRNKIRQLEMSIRLGDIPNRRRAIEQGSLLTESRLNSSSSTENFVIHDHSNGLNRAMDECDISKLTENNKENCSSNGLMTYGGAEVRSASSTLKRSAATLKDLKRMEDVLGIDIDEDPLASILKVSGGSKRNALLKWSQGRTEGYRHVEITNFSTSWTDGMALCALLHSFVPDKIQYDSLHPKTCRENLEIAFKVAESLSIQSTLSVAEMMAEERPPWEKVMNYVKEIYVKLGICDEKYH